METCFVARDNSGVLTEKLGRETSLVAYSTDKRSIQKSWSFKFFKIAHTTICIKSWPDYAEHIICFILLLWLNKFKQSDK